MDRQPVLEGERLLLRPLTPDDWDALYAVASDPLVWELHPASDRWKEGVFRAYFADALAQGGALAVIDKDTGAIIGSSRMQRHDPADGGTVEIGWTFLSRDYWGGAYNREMKTPDAGPRAALCRTGRFPRRRKQPALARCDGKDRRTAERP